jgi:hypothetical protein
MLHEVATVFEMMAPAQRDRVVRRVEVSGSLPVARDTPSYQALMSILWGGGGGLAGLGYGGGGGDDDDDDEHVNDSLNDSLGISGLGDDDADDEEEEEEDRLAKTGGGFGETAHLDGARWQAKADATRRVAQFAVSERRALGVAEADGSGSLFADAWAPTDDDDLDRLDALVAAVG